MAIEISTPVGRLVWGDPTKPKTKTDPKTRAPILDANGQPRQQWTFGVAFDKATFQQSIWPAMAQEAATAFPNGVPPAFSWKYVDGDGVDREGKPYSEREGYAGCYVLAISTELMAPPVFKLVNGAYQQLPPGAMKCGDYVALGLNLKVNVPTDRTQTPGLYVNPLAIEFVGYGTEIVGTGSADPMALFKGAQHQLPPGASATPIGNANAPGMPGMGMQQPGQPPMSAPMGQQPMGQPGYPQQQPMQAPGQMPMGQPGQMPGMMPGR